MRFSLPLTLLLCPLILAARETLEESAVHTRELISYRAYGVGTLMSRYPDDFEDPELRGLPIGLQEYYAEYPESNGDILLLVMPISKIYRNALPPNRPNLTLTISDLYGFGDGHLSAGRMRVALFGSLHPVPEQDKAACQKAYLEKHSDSRGWIGQGGPHVSWWMRFKVEKVYAFDGFGDVAYIGWIPLPLYRSSGSQMRSEKEVHRHWPVPKQPEDTTFTSGRGWELFAETGLRMSEPIGLEDGKTNTVEDEEEKEETMRKERFRIQL